MEQYDYEEAVRNDVEEYVKEHYEPEYLKEIFEDEEKLNPFKQTLQDDLWIEDSVTGNRSGSYTFNRWKAEEYLCHNIDLLMEALEEFGCSDLKRLGAEGCDVTIRCYLLPDAIDNALSNIQEEIENHGNY